MYKLIIFDLGDIFYDTKYLVGAKREIKLLLKEGISKKDCNLIKWNKLYKDSKTGRITLQEARIKYLKLLNYPKKTLYTIEKIDKTYEQKMKLKDIKTAFYLYLIKNAGFKIAALTDTTNSEHKIKKILSRLEIAIYFDKIFCSTSIGYIKPDKRAYFSVLNNFNLYPAEALFVGHDREELNGAQNLGITTIKFCNNLQNITNKIILSKNG